MKSRATAGVELKTALAALAISALWGGNVVALKVGLGTFPPFWSAFWRMLTGLPVIAGWARVLGSPLKPASGEWKWLMALGAVFAVQISVLNLGVNLTSAAYAVVLMNSNPVFTNLIAHFFVPGDKLSRTRALGLAIAFAGICFAFLGEPEPRLASNPLLGNTLATLTAMIFGARMVFTQRLVQRIEPLRAIFWQIAFSIPCFLLAATLLEEPLRRPLAAPPVLAVLYQGVIVAGGCFVVWVRLLRKTPPGVLSVFAFPTPIFGVIASAFIFSEKLAPELMAGVAAVAAGILIVTLETSRGQTREVKAAGDMPAPVR